MCRAPGGLRSELAEVAAAASAQHGALAWPWQGPGASRISEISHAGRAPVCSARVTARLNRVVQRKLWGAEVPRLCCGYWRMETNSLLWWCLFGFWAVGWAQAQRGAERWRLTLSSLPLAVISMQTQKPQRAAIPSAGRCVPFSLMQPFQWDGEALADTSTAAPQDPGHCV